MGRTIKTTYLHITAYLLKGGENVIFVLLVKEHLWTTLQLIFVERIFIYDPFMFDSIDKQINLRKGQKISFSTFIVKILIQENDLLQN